MTKEGTKMNEQMSDGKQNSHRHGRVDNSYLARTSYTRGEYTHPSRYRTYSGIRRKLFQYDAYEAIRPNLLTSIVTRTDS